MAGDYTRMTFTPRKDHAGVLMQQGRVTLDADWNELVELVDRRFRAETVDVVGRMYVSKETPHAFEIAFAGTSMTIGPGRAYVDGLLAECHGAATPTEYDPVLAEVRGKAPIEYLSQPYLPDAAIHAPLPAAGTWVVYLDAWERELTYLEDPDLVEKAIAVDTATRLQTAWQVRLLGAGAGTTCTSDLHNWDDLTKPSGGRLTTSAVGVPAATDPCTIPQSGGYRGTENRLYRVEIHDAGPLGAATFKWSRDNASVASRVTGINSTGTQLTLDRIGRDGVRRIRVDDWVEVIDDDRELLGVPGELRKVQAVDEVNETITLTAAVPVTGAAGFDQANPTARHTRVVRWDEAGPAVDAGGGKMQVPGAAGTPIVLEDGVQIAFDHDATGGDFHVGDYWVFAARTADASVELLVEEPPRGVKHHFCRLAVVTFPSTVDSDCRIPPDQREHGCDCTVCVTPESHASGLMTIYQAVQDVGPVGGKICLQPGFYLIERPVRIRGARSLHLQGKGWKTVLQSTGQAPAITVEASAGVTIDSITVATTTPAKRGVVPMGIAIALQNTIGTIVERCVLAQVSGLLGRFLGGSHQPVPAAAESEPQLRSSFVGAQLGPSGSGAPLITLDGIVAEASIRENVLVGGVGIGPVAVDPYTSLAEQTSMDVGLVDRERSSRSQDVFPLREYLVSIDLSVRDNLFVCSLNGVALEGYSLQLGETRIAGNSVAGCLRSGISSLGMVGPVGRADVVGNLLRIFGTGIASGTDDTRICDNDVASLLAARSLLEQGVGEVLVPMLGVGAVSLAQWSLSAGIVLTPALRPTAIDRCLVAENRVVRVVGDGISVSAPAASLSVAHNVVQTIGRNGIAATAPTQLLAIESNQVLDVGLAPRTRTDSLAGIVVTGSSRSRIDSNLVRGVAVSDANLLLRAGIEVSAVGVVRIADNDISGIGPDGEFTGEAAGIDVGPGWEQLDIDHNSVRRQLGDFPLLSRWYGIRATLESPILWTTVGRTGAIMTPVALLLVSAAFGKIVVLPRGRASLGIHGNVVEAYGQVPAVVVDSSGTCLFADNRCFLASATDSQDGVQVTLPVARINAGALIANANYLEGPTKADGMTITLPADAGYTVLGNVASGPITVNGGAPHDKLNVP